MLPSNRSRTVTTVGLPARKEQLIKSMLLAVNVRTADRWTFADGLEADVAICGVESTLAAVAVAREQRDGRPHCVWLVSDGADPPQGRRIQDPIGSSSLIALLDGVSDLLRPPDVAAVVVPAPAAAPATGHRTRLDVAVMLRDLLDQESGDTFRVAADGVELRIVPATRTVRASHPLTDETIARILNPASGARIEWVPDPAGELALPHPLLDVHLLWRAGLAAGGDELLAPLSPDLPVVLSRWPDFGRVPHGPAHVQMAARLTRRPQRVADVAAAVHRPLAEVVAFLNACVLCGLAGSSASAAASVTGTGPAQRPLSASAAAAAPSYRGILRSIRSALGLGGR